MFEIWRERARFGPLAFERRMTCRAEKYRQSCHLFLSFLEYCRIVEVPTQGDPAERAWGLRPFFQSARLLDKQM